MKPQDENRKLREYIRQSRQRRRWRRLTVVLATAAAVLTLGNTAPLYYLPVLLGVSLFTGALTGLIAACLLRALGHTKLWEVQGHG